MQEASLLSTLHLDLQLDETSANSISHKMAAGTEGVTLMIAFFLLFDFVLSGCIHSQMARTFVATLHPPLPSPFAFSATSFSDQANLSESRLSHVQAIVDASSQRGVELCMPG
jgi:hypothetical protein